MLTLKDLCTALETDSVWLRGQEREVRALTARETRMVREWFPRPTPPLAPDPSAGSASAKLVPDYLDERYQNAMNAWSEKVQLVECAMALGYVCGDGCAAVAGEPWGSKAFDELHGVLTDKEVGRVAEAWGKLAQGLEEKIEKAQGN